MQQIQVSNQEMKQGKIVEWKGDTKGTKKKRQELSRGSNLIVRKADDEAALCEVVILP
jgi:hypothetical protein